MDFVILSKFELYLLSIFVFIFGCFFILVNFLLVSLSGLSIMLLVILILLMLCMGVV